MIGPSVGVRFLEIMSGPVGESEYPVAGAELGRKSGAEFRFRLQIVIPRLREFLISTRHVAQIASGQIDWLPGMRNRDIFPGTVELYRSDPANTARKYFDFHFSFPGIDGTVWSAEGHKYLFDDRGFEAARDLSTVFLRFRNNSHGNAAGVTTVHIGELLRQLQSIEITGAATRQEEDAAREAFFGFMNDQLRNIYRYMPQLLTNELQLSGEERRTLRLCAEVMLPVPIPPQGPQVDDVLNGVEEFIQNATAAEVATIRNWLKTAGTILPVLKPNKGEIREFIAREFRRRDRGGVKEVLELLHLLVVFPYYAHPKADALVGYARPTFTRKPASTPLPIAAKPADREYDVVIAGSGPGGAVVASRMAAQGKSVLVVEAGPYIPENTIDSNEVLWTARLFKESALQRANNAQQLLGVQPPSFLVLQGSCVGGGSVVNNAVCFRMPKKRVDEWGDIGFPISYEDLDAAYTAIAAETGIVPVSRAAKRLNPAIKYLGSLGNIGVPPVSDPPRPGLYECMVNLEELGPGRGCQSTGLCNVGCGAESKRNALQVFLKDAAKHDCVIVPDTRVVDIELAFGAGAPRARSMTLKHTSGKISKVRAKQFVLACGPIASSELLLRAPQVRTVLEHQNVPVGRRFSANIGSPLFAFVREPVNAQPSLQIAHYYVPAEGEGYVIETWFNPPGANAMAMPGFLDEHHKRMSRYRQTVAAAPLVGTRANGRIRFEDNRLTVHLPVTAYEINRLRTGLTLLGKAFFEGGVESALAAFDGGRTLNSAKDVQQLNVDIFQMANNPGAYHRLKFGTGHPQGGNAMSQDPAVGVVLDDGQVRGIPNLRVCDGSIFPDSAGVNPQWTIMALAHLCAARIPV